MKDKLNFKYPIASVSILLLCVMMPFRIDARILFFTSQDSAVTDQKAATSPDSLKLQLPDTTASDSLQQKQTPKLGKKIQPFQYHLTSFDSIQFSLHHQEFDKYIYRHLGDLVKQLPGVELHDFVSTGLPALIRLRGSSFNQPAIFIDGFPVTHPQFGAFDLNLLPSQGFESIAMNQENQFAAPSGSIDLKTRAYPLKKPYTELVWHKGRHGDSEVDVTFGRRLGKETVAIGGYTNKSSQGRHLHSEYLAQKIRLQVQSRVHPNWDLNYKLFNTKSEFEYPGPAYWQPEISNLDAKQKSILWSHLVTLHGDVTDDSQEDLNLKLYYNSLFQDYQDKSYKIEEVYHNRFLGSQIEGYFPLFTRELTIGGRTEFRWMKSETVKNTLFFDATLFSKYQFPITHAFNLKTNFLLEINNKFGLFFTPNFILSHQMIPGIATSLEYQHARRVPDFFALYWNRTAREPWPGDSISTAINPEKFRYMGNPNLSPEEIDNFTLNMNIKPWPWLNVKASPYFRYIQHYISLQQIHENKSPTFFNQKQVFFYGYDQWLEIRIFKDLAVAVNIHYLVSRDENKKGLPDQPNLTASGLITYRRQFFRGNLKTRYHLGARLLGERWNLVNGNYPFPAYYFSTNVSHGGYEPALDIKAVATIRDMDIIFSFENLLGRKYHYLAGYPMRELAYYWGINWKFWD